jgi:hypothetical protein
MPFLQVYVSSNVNPMRGTIAFERLQCASKKVNTVNVRILLNDAVYRESTLHYIYLLTFRTFAFPSRPLASLFSLYIGN